MPGLRADPPRHPDRRCLHASRTAPARYASAITAAASQDQLDQGRRWCFLFTDLANPTSNRIYQAIGYRSIRDVLVIRFDRP